MLYKKGILLLLLLFSYNVNADCIVVDFYSKKIKINYDKSMFVKFTLKSNDGSVKKCYSMIENTNYRILLEDIKRKKNELYLNDWLYYKLVDKVTEELLKGKSENNKQFFCWFILLKSGYDVIMSYDQPFNMYVFTEDIILRTDEFFIKKKKYVKISTKSISHGEFSYCNFFPNNKEIKAFDFSIIQPSFSNDSSIVIERKCKIRNVEKAYVYKVSKSLIEIMKDYPPLKSEEYFKCKLSKLVYNSLLPQLKKEIENIETKDAIRYLLSFVRLSFGYKEDKDAFGYSRPMIVEESLYYNYGDCEDKSVLFYYLVKELIDVPMLILKYPNHINIAVKLDKPYGKPYEYNGIKYSVCEPTESGDTRDIGDVPQYVKYPNPKVIGKF